jgi:hypothetical protein
MHRLGLVESFHALQAAGLSGAAAAAALNQPLANVWRWHRAWLRGGFNALLPGISPGRPRKKK